MTTTAQVRRFAHLVNGGTPPPDEGNWNGSVNWATPVDVGRNHGGVIESTERTITEEGLRAGSAQVPAGSLVLSTRAPVGYVARAGVDLAFNQGCKGLVTLPGVDERYLAYALINSIPEMEARATGTTFLELSTSGLAALPVPVREQREQTAIAHFLDRETAQIDALVAEQRELVRLLEERRSSMIWRLVTKGVRKTDMRDSGAMWIGSVPSHWGVHRLKNSVASSRSGVWGEEPTGDGTDARCVRVADFDRPRLRVHDLDITMRSVEPRDLRERGLRDGDLLLEKSGGTARNPVGFVVMYEGSGPAVCSNFVSRVRVKPDQVPRYWLYAHAASYTHRLTQRSVNQTTGIQNLDEGAYFNEPFPFPPHDEQAEIADRLDSSTARMDAMIDAANESIALMLERRAALISAAVTGRIDPHTGKEIKEAS